MTWTEKVIQKALTHPYLGIVPFTRYIAVPNIRSGVAVKCGESDLIAVSESGYIKEFEIKVSVSDLKRDKKKLKHRLWESSPVRELWYAMPEEVVESVDVTEHIPEYAGIVAVRESTYRLGLGRERPGYRCRIVRKAKAKSSAKKLSTEEILSVARLGVIRLWGGKEQEESESHAD